MSLRVQSAAVAEAADISPFAPESRAGALLDAYAQSMNRGDLQADMTPGSTLDHLASMPMLPHPDQSIPTRAPQLSPGAEQNVRYAYAATLSIRDLPLPEMAHMTLDALAAISVEQVSVMTAAQLQVLRERYEAPLGIEALDAAAAAARLAMLLATDEPAIVIARTPAICSRLTAAHLEELGSGAIKAMGAHLSNIPPIVFCCLSDEQLQAIPGEGIRAMTSAQLEALSERQLLTFTPVQRALFGDVQRRGRVEEVWLVDHLQRGVAQAAGVGNPYDLDVGADV